MNFLTGLKAYTFQALSAVLLALLLFQTWNLHRSVTNLSNLKVQHAETLKDISEKTTKTTLAVVLSQQQWSAALNQKDVKFRKELKDELKINDDLRNDVALGNRRLRLLGASCTKPTDTGEVSSTASLDDAAAADAVGLLLATALAQHATLVIATHDARVASLLPPDVIHQMRLEPPQNGNSSL